MITAKVYRTVPRPWYFNTERRQGEPLDAFFHLMADIFCTPMPNDVKEQLRDNARFMDWLAYEAATYSMRFKNAMKMGEDYNFFLKVQRFGFDVFCDLDASYELRHIGEQQIGLQRPNSETAGDPEKTSP